MSMQRDGMLGAWGGVRTVICALAFWLCGHAWGADRDPLSYPLKHYGLILGMSLLGGFAGWYAKVRKGEVSGASMFALIGEMATSSLAGLGAFLLCDHLEVPIGLTGAAAGIAGYMGGRAIELAERVLQDRINRRAQP